MKFDHDLHIRCAWIMIGSHSRHAAFGKQLFLKAISGTEGGWGMSVAAEWVCVCVTHTLSKIDWMVYGDFSAKLIE